MYNEDTSRFSEPEMGIFTGFGVSKVNKETNYRKMIIINENGTNLYTRYHANKADSGPAEYKRGCVYRLFHEISLVEMEQIQDIVENNLRMTSIDIENLLC